MAEEKKNGKRQGPALFLYRGRKECEEHPLTADEQTLADALRAMATMANQDPAVMAKVLEIAKAARAQTEQAQLSWLLENKPDQLVYKAKYDVRRFLQPTDMACQAVLEAAGKSGIYRKWREGDTWKDSGTFPYRYELDKKTGMIRLSSNLVAAARVMYFIAGSQKKGVRMSFAETGDRLVALGALTQKQLADIRKQAGPLAVKAGGSEQELEFRPTAGRQLAQAKGGGLTATMAEMAGKG